MEPHGIVLAAGTSTTGWVIGYTIGIVVVLVVVALVVPILLLARSIGNEAPKINDALTEAVHNTAPLGALRTTIEHATIIIGGLQRGRPGREVTVESHALAMSGTEHTLWVTAIILGFVVVLAVAALLSVLVWLVKIIDRRVVQIGGTLQAAADNTADTVLIPQVADGVEAVLAEGLQHHLFLGRVLGKVKS